MNQQTNCSLKASIMEYKENSQISNSKESVSSRQEFQDMPYVLELTRIMLGTIAMENARKMTLNERHVFYSMANGLLSLAHSLS